MSQIGKALFTTTQRQVLKLLYGEPAKSFYTSEILHLTHMGVATIKRELDRMVAAGILITFFIGNQKHYQANPECPIYHELLLIVKKTLGVKEIIKTALTPILHKITWAFIYGSIASENETQSSDIDLMIIGDTCFSEVAQLLFDTQAELGREINAKVYSVREWQQSRKDENGFIKSILNKPMIDILGNGDELR